jgi:hypothetical protein
MLSVTTCRPLKCRQESKTTEIRTAQIGSRIAQMASLDAETMFCLALDASSMLLTNAITDGMRQNVMHENASITIKGMSLTNRKK